jgi:hypothetical protein
MRTANFAVLLAALSLGGCDLLQGEDPAKVAAAREADGKAIGAACRHSGRALEDCYVMNAKALRSAVYAGWLEMDGYMRDNKIPIAVPDLVEPPVSDKAVADLSKTPEGKAATEEDTTKKPAAETKKKASAKRGASFLAPLPTPLRRTT